ncbi:efflux RND transporter periplasmic adaptor subunit [soil metagenome]
MSTSRKIFIAFIAILICAAVLGLLVLYKMNQFAGFAKMKWTPPPTAVTSIVATEQEWRPSVKAVGTVAAVQGVIVSTDEPGIVTKINFESGQFVKEGDLLVQLDIGPEVAQLASAQAQQRLADLNLQRQQNLLKSHVSAQADFDSAKAQFDQTTARVEEVKSLINKKTIRAPFSGQLGLRMVNLGQYLQSGAQVAPLQSLDPIYVNFYVPQQHLGSIHPGQEVNIKVDSFPGRIFAGKITALDSVVDEATRNVRIQATLPNTDGTLRPGMYVNVDLPGSESARFVTLPSTAIQFAPYGDSVFIIEEMTEPDPVKPAGQAGSEVVKPGSSAAKATPAPEKKKYLGARQQIIKIGQSEGDRFAVISGVKPGEQVVTAGGFKLHQGDAVVVNNELLPSNEKAPTPQDN